MSTTVNFPNGDSITFPEGTSDDIIQNESKKHYEKNNSVGVGTEENESGIHKFGKAAVKNLVTAISAPGKAMNWVGENILDLPEYKDSYANPVDAMKDLAKNSAITALKVAPFLINPASGVISDTSKVAPLLINPAKEFLKNTAINAAVNAVSSAGSSYLEGDSVKDSLIRGGKSGGVSALMDTILGG
ncbi:MAG: hypothetical protein WCH21_12135, partial [Bacteroidota bacterium]